MEIVGSAPKFLRGTFRNVKVEPGGRIVVPRGWREIYPITHWIGCPWPLVDSRSIGVFPVASWESRYQRLLMSRMDASNAGDRKKLEQLNRVKVLMDSSAEDLKLDKLGRLCLGSHLTSIIGLEREAVLRAAGDYFEVFTSAGYQADHQRQQRGVDLETLQDCLLLY